VPRAGAPHPAGVEHAAGAAGQQPHPPPAGIIPGGPTARQAGSWGVQRGPHPTTLSISIDCVCCEIRHNTNPRRHARQALDCCALPCSHPSPGIHGMDLHLPPRLCKAPFCTGLPAARIAAALGQLQHAAALGPLIMCTHVAAHAYPRCCTCLPTLLHMPTRLAAHAYPRCCTHVQLFCCRAR
jgi:hypothetical protein